MRTLIAIALCITIIPGGAQAKTDCPEFAGADTVIYHACKKQWPEDFHMLKYCIDGQEQALADLKKRFCNLTKDEEKM